MTSTALAVFGITHADLPTTDLARALRIHEGLLGFCETARGDGWIDLDAGGTITLRLVQVARVDHRCTLRVRVGDVQACVDALVASGLSLTRAAQRTAESTLAATLRDEDGHAICVWRHLSEDEYDTAPELPKVKTWTPEADALLKQLLKGVPALFRALARRKVTRVTESLADPRQSVGTEDVIRGFILASPRITRERNRKPLLEAGVDVARYQAEWDAP